MAELIDRAALRKAIMADYGSVSEEWGESNYQSGLTIAIVSIDEAPTIDAAPVVKCKDCIYKGGYDCPLAYAIEWGIGIDAPGDDDYCSAGKRMDADAPERGGEGKE